MHFILSFVVAIQLASTFVHSAPTAALDSATLLKNGQDAQKLNAQFQNAKASTSCNDGDTTCIGNAIAKCVNGAFDTSTGKCSKSQSCFAIPNVKAEGTTLACTSNKSALSLINATGATGDVTGAGSSNSNDKQTSTAAPSTMSQGMDEDCTMTSSTTSTQASRTTAPAGPDSNDSASAPARVTVTVTVSATEVTLPTTVRTISPSDASIILSSLAQEATPTSTVPSISTTPTTPASPSDVVISSASASAPPAFTIVLTAPGAAATNSPVVSASATSVPPALTISLNEADPASTSAIAAAAITSAPVDSSGGYSSGGYGGY